MTAFVEELRLRIDRIMTSDDVSSIYEWLWNNQQAVADSATTINEGLNLQGAYALQPDLPCLAVGSLSNLVVMAANPGWGNNINLLENNFGLASINNYLDITRNFFYRHPRVVGRCTNWWSRAISYIALLPGQEDYFSQKLAGGQTRWDIVQHDNLIGGWELFPWHSQRDQLTSQMNDYPWLQNFYLSSINAIIRIQPRLLFIASKPGHNLIRNILEPNLQWYDFQIGQKRVFQGSYVRLENNTEIVTFKGQLFANMPRKFTDQDFFGLIRQIRIDYANRQTQRC